MSLLRTVVLEPSSHTNTKTVFRIPSAGKLLMPELRICNFGVTTSGTANGQETYTYGQGIYALLKAVRLYANNILIDQFQDSSRFLVLKNLNTTTNYGYDVNQRTICSNVNMQDEYAPGFTGLKPILNKLLGRLDLSSVLSFLNAVPMLYNYPELRVELEYYTDVTSIFSEDGNSGDPGFTFQVNMPSMLYTQEMDEDKLALVKGEAPKMIAFFAWEREFIQSVNFGQLQSPRVRAFDSKFVNKLVLQKLWNVGRGRTQNVKLGYGRSDAFSSEQINYIINGSKQLMFNGHDLPSRRSAQVNDLLGPIVTPFNSWNTMSDATQLIMFESMYDLTGSLSWDAVSVGRVINRLDVEMTFNDDRFGEDDTLDVWVWASVLKFVNVLPSGQIVVGYQANGTKV